MTKSVVQVLREARELLSDPKRWTQRMMAKDEFGEAVCSKSEQAVCWCVMGAITKVSDNSKVEGDAIDIIGQVMRSREIDYEGGLYLGSIATWQDVDGRAHGEVIHVLDLAISEAEKRPQSGGRDALGRILEKLREVE